MINFNSVTIKNFMSIGEAEVPLSGVGFTLISGENRRIEDSAGSNGVGKSSISESIVWSLTGETIRGHKEVVNRYTEEDCEVTVDFEFKGHSWKVIRGANRKNKKSLSIYKDGKLLPSKGYSDSQEVLARELPEITYKFLNSVVILGQGLPGRFTNNTPSGRKAVLEELTNADYMITQIKESISKRASSISFEIEQMKLGQTRITTNQATYTSQVAKLREILENLSKVEVGLLVQDLSEIEKRGNEIKAQIEVGEEEEKKLLSARNENKEKYQIDSSELTKALGDKRSSLIKERGEKVSELMKKKAEEEVSLIEEKSRIDSEIKELKRQADDLTRKINGGICPTCKRPLESISPEQLARDTEERDNLILQVKKLTDDFNEVSAKLGEIDRKYVIEEGKIGSEYNQKLSIEEITGKSKLDILRIRYEETEGDYRKRAEDIGSKLYSWRKSLTDLRAEYAEKKEKVKNHNERVAETNREIDEYTLKLSVLANELEIVNGRLEVCQEKAAIIKKMETFASRDFRGILLEGVISRLDTILKGYAQQVYGNQLTSFYQDGNAIVVEFDGKEYESLSGGEQQKINVLLQLSLRDLIIELTGNSGSFILLDEVFDGLDSKGCEAIINVIQNLQTNVFTITHHPELEIPYDRNLLVVKQPNGVAYIQEAV